MAKQGKAEPTWLNKIVRYTEEPPEQLLASPWNFRVHPKQQQSALAGAMTEVGWIAPVIINEVSQHCIDGHLRIAMAISNGQKTIPVVYVNLTEAEEQEALLTFDALGTMAAKDKAQLDILLHNVQSGDAAIQELLAGLAKESGLHYGDEPTPDPGAQIDQAAELQKKWGTELGQLWTIGKHRLICGDCTDPAVVARVMGGDKPNLMVTDPPYGVEYDPNWRNEAAAAGHLAYAASRIGQVHNDDRVDWSDAYRLFTGDVLYTWSPGGDHVILTGQAVQASGFEIRNQIIWSKSNFPISRGAYTYRHEPCWYAVRKGAKAHWIGPATECTVWEINLDKNVEGGHSTQKPLECMERPIRNHEGDVYDPFLGSGTTMVAAERQGRRCYACEIAPEYVAVALERMAGLGLSPVLEP